MTKYETLANKLRSKIISGVYKEGDMLPSENELVASKAKQADGPSGACPA